MGFMSSPQYGRLISGVDGLTSWAYELLRIDNETITQFTGLFDGSGTPIFDGDILKCYNSAPDVPDEIGTVFWSREECRWLRTSDRADVRPLSANCVYKVVGNIYDREISTGGDLNA